MARFVFDISVFVSFSAEHISTEGNGDFVSFCLLSLLNSGMSLGAQYNLKGPVLEINWLIRTNAGSISPI